MHSIWEEFSRLIFHVEVDIAPAQAEEAFAPPAADTGDVRYSGGGPDQPSALESATAVGGGEPGAVPTATAPAGNGDGIVETKVNTERENIGRNDPCWCGSGKKYKKCHGA
jgi:preprotein translocase subunit SecA